MMPRVPPLGYWSRARDVCARGRLAQQLRKGVRRTVTAVTPKHRQVVRALSIGVGHSTLTPMFLFFIAVCAAAPPPQDWSHGWDTLLEAQFADFGYAPYTDADATFLAS